eukprot:COSAG02_NODE_3733_length_6312_cov_3.880251_2_plen_140_part_00
MDASVGGLCDGLLGFDSGVTVPPRPRSGPDEAMFHPDGSGLLVDPVVIPREIYLLTPSKWTVRKAHRASSKRSRPVLRARCLPSSRSRRQLSSCDPQNSTLSQRILPCCLKRLPIHSAGYHTPMTLDLDLVGIPTTSFE